MSWLTSPTRRWIRRVAVATACGTVAACADATGPAGLPLPVLWIEWPAAVAPGQAVTVRVVGVGAQCARTELRLEDAYPVLRVVAEAVEPVEQCRILADVVATVYDTTLTLPRLNPADVQPYQVRAYMRGLLFDPFAEHTVGYLAVGTPDAGPNVAGEALLVPDSLTCAWIHPSTRNETHLVLSPLAVTSTRPLGAIVSGRTIPALPPLCGENAGIYLDYVQVSVQ